MSAVLPPRWDSMVTALDGAESLPIPRGARQHRPLRQADIDWSTLVWDLERKGMSQRDIGVRCGLGDRSDMGKVTVNQLKNIPGTQPRLHIGLPLILLWIEVVGGDMESLPCIADLRRISLHLNPPKPARRMRCAVHESQLHLFTEVG